MRMILWSILTGIIFGCGEGSSSAGGSNYGKGKARNGLEEGFWEYQGKSKTLEKKGYYEHGFKTGEWKYMNGDTVRNVHWLIHDDTLSKLKVNYPNTWKVIRQRNKLFFALTEDNVREYSIILKIDKGDGVGSLDGYLREVYEVMKNDEEEIFTGYTMREIIFENGRRVFSGDLYSEWDGKEYIIFVMYTESEGCIFDMTQKALLDDVFLKRKLFHDFVYSICVEGEKFFYVDDYIKSHRLVDLDSMFKKYPEG